MSSLNARIPTDLHRKLRVEAINRGATVQQLVTDAVRLILGEKPELPPKPKAR